MKDYDKAPNCSKNFYSAILDGVTDFLDDKFMKKNWQCPFSDAYRQSTYGTEFRRIMNLVRCRAEHITSFLIVYYGRVRDSTQVLDHVDSLNGGASSYEYTVCLHLQMVPESLLDVPNPPVVRQVVNMNSRGSIDNKTKLVATDTMFKCLDIYKDEVNESYQTYNDSYEGDPINHPCRELSCGNYLMLVLMKLIDWDKDPHKDNYNVEPSPSLAISQCYNENVQFRWIRLRAAPSRNYFQSAAASIWFSLIMKFRDNINAMDSLKALLLRGIYMAV